jgi:protein-histidine pros-kinase
MNTRPVDLGRSAGIDALLAAVPDAMLAVDPQGLVVAANARCEPILGYLPEELVGQPVEVLVPEALRSEHAERRASYAGHPALRDLVAVRKDGSRLPVEISLAPLETREGPLVLTAVRDVSGSRHSERLFRRFVESAPDAVVVVDGTGRIVLVNAQVEQMFGYERAELMGQPVEVLVPDAAAGMHAHLRASYVDRPRTRPIGAAGGLFGKHRSGRVFPVEISLSPMETDDGLLVLADVRDITHRLEAVAAVHAAEERERLQEETQRVKDEFLATVSHELRTPLASIVGYTELIIDHEDLGPELAHFLTVIMRNARREMRLVDDLLMLVDIGERGLPIRAQPVDLAGVVRDAVDSARPEAHAGGLVVGLDLPDDPLVVACDGDRIGQALDILLSNALKFTPAGGTVDVRLYATDAMARIEVEDSGVGIGAPEPHRVFERLYRSPTAVAREVPGAGLGLSIAAAIVEAHQGSIRVLNSDSSGSTFGLQIPLVR